jgi:thiosulfate reductase cytochrome b subunit
VATFGTTVRQGLPRRPGGEPWPPAGTAAPVVAAPVAAPVAATPVAEPVEAVAPPALTERAASSLAGTTPPSPAVPASVQSGRMATGEQPRIRRGLPRVPGGEPWPPASAIAARVVGQELRDDTSPVDETAVPPAVATSVAPAEQTVPLSQAAVAAPDAGRLATGEQRSLRRGLPRVPGGEAWPPAGSAPAPRQIVVETVDVVPDSAGTDVVVPVAASVVPVLDAPSSDVSVPLPFTRTVFAGSGGRAPVIVRPEPKRYGPFTKVQWAGAAIVGGGGLLVAAALAVLAVRWFLSLTFMQDFLVTYPGEYHLPEGAPVGIPPWLGWQHFFNVFLMVLIIRSGLQVRNEKRPSVFWSPRTNPKRKISLNLWFHQSLDILWVLNGVVFVVLLFATGQWMKIVPTSWEVFPNAISAALQYVSLDWPTENGWVNYNSLQQIAYFATVFIAAPLAIVTGVRMSGIWPKNAKTLSRIYPVELARAIHFPVMLYFVVFIAIHVILVLATGALRNLNHMYASLGSTDPTAYADNWIGFWLFVASLVIIAAAWVAARPLVLAPIARLFGKVSGR